MKKNIFTIFILSLLVFASCQKVKEYKGDISLLPYPNEIEQDGKCLVIGNKVSLSIPDNSNLSATYIADELNKKGISSTQTTGSGDINFILLANDSLDKEAYQLQVSSNGVDIKASNTKGLFYGFQTLLQLINTQDGETVIPTVTIKDQPAFAWRAFMLDESRYFKGAEEVKKLLDQMAYMKMNVFHWHLTDDNGWRIEIKKYPLLTEVGSVRDSSQVGTYPDGWKSEIYDGVPHKGFYTQEEIKDIIAYAAERNIDIMPEIEMPGHASAAIAAYPWLSTTGKQIKVPAQFGVKYDIFNVSDEKVVRFLEDVLDEVCELFPFDVVHIGGDEVKYDQWKQSAQVRAFMQKNNLKTPADLQIWFTNNISSYLQGKGKRMMGWNEITGDNVHEYTDAKDARAGQTLASNAIVQFWRGDLDLIKRTADKGYNVVNSFHEYTYLDYDTITTPLEKSYSFNPVMDGLSEKEAKQIIGIGTQMWGEWIPTNESMYEKVYPRIAAYAETGWTKKENKSWERFQKILQSEQLN